MIKVDPKNLLNKLNSYCMRSITTSAGICISSGNYEITIEHLLSVMIEDPEYDFQNILRYFEIEPARVQKALRTSLDELKVGNAGKPVFSDLLMELIQEAWSLASLDFNLARIRSGILITTILLKSHRFTEDIVSDELSSIKAEDLRENFFSITENSKEEVTIISEEAQESGQRIEAQEQIALKKFTIDFTGNAREGRIDPVFCRDREIRQMIDILARRRKNNPIVVGEAGVGKTAVVEGLALKIVEDDVPDILKNVEIYGLDLGLLQAGAGVKGEFENRLKSVINEVKSSPKPIILFIDEAHTMIGAGGPAGGGDAANLLKPALARGELRTIAATTWSEYKKYFEKDPALARRFQLVKLDEPSADDAVVIMRGLKANYEKAHNIYIQDNAVIAAAKLSARYISGRQLPDKAVDLLDTASARVKISINAKPNEIDDRERKIMIMQRELRAIERDISSGAKEDIGQIKELEDQIKEIENELIHLNDRWQKELEIVKEVIKQRDEISETLLSETKDEEAILQMQQKKTELLDELSKIQGDDPLIHYEVAEDLIGKVISDWTGIPVGKMVKDEANIILKFPDELKKRIKGQGHAIEAISRGLRASKAGLNNPNTPIGVFLFVGPSGVGKTEIGLGVADLLFGGERFMVTINMSEFQEKHTVSRLIGSPPGYVGYGEGGVLSEGVRQRPYSVVLLDEVEKADPEVMNIFYQVFDKGTLSDGEGREIDFKNTILFLTSNLASDVITAMCTDGDRPAIEDITSAIRPILSSHFKPALLARMTIVPFYPISKDVMEEIVELKLNHLVTRLKNHQKMDLIYTPNVIGQIADRCKEVETGARNIDHIMNGTLIPQIATQILELMGEASMPNVLRLDIKEDGNFSYNFE